MGIIHLGVVGCGVMGTKHMEVASECPGVEITAVADRFEDKARAAAGRFGASGVHTEGGALIEDAGVDAVVLATATCDRSELGVRALAAGKHLLTEKPVAMNAADVERMIEARGDRVAACCSSRMRFSPSAQAAAEVVASGALGELRVLHCRAHHACGARPETPRPAWRLTKALNGGGILVNWGCYDLDYLLGLAGWSLEPETVLAQAWQIPEAFGEHIAPGSDAETHFAAMIRCAGGEVISFERGEFMPARGNSVWQITGTRGALNLDMVPGEGKVITLDEASPAEGVVSRTVWQGDEDWNVMHRGPVLDFIEAIRSGGETSTGLERALVVQRISDAIYASAERGEPVAVG